MTRHASAEQLALLAAGELGRRKAARIGAHVAGCTVCTHVSEQLATVSVTLESVHYPPLPDRFAARIEIALATESAERVAAAPATEAGRRDLPARQQARINWRRGWRLPWLSVTASRLVTAAAALVIIGVGGYAVATSVGAGTSGAPARTGAPAALSAPTQLLTLGPTVTYGRPGALHAIRSVRSSTDFAPDHLPSEVVAAVRAAQLKGISPTSVPSVKSPSAANQASLSAGAAAPAAGSGTATRLAGCINLITPGRTVVLVEQAEYQGTPATIIVAAASGTTSPQAWVVGDSCSATNSDVLAHISLGHV